MADFRNADSFCNRKRTFANNNSKDEHGNNPELLPNTNPVSLVGKKHDHCRWKQTMDRNSGNASQLYRM